MNFLKIFLLTHILLLLVCLVFSICRSSPFYSIYFCISKFESPKDIIITKPEGVDERLLTIAIDIVNIDEILEKHSPECEDRSN